MARKKKHEKEQNLERWLISYADFISLLMFFFFVMFSASQVQKEKLLAISESLRRALTNEAVMAPASNVTLFAIASTDKTTGVTKVLKQEMRGLGITKGVSFSTDERGVIITIMESIFFDAGEFVIKPKFQPLLKKLGMFIKDTNTRTVVEGHTDNMEINKPLIHSNWELSTLRATSVVRFFIKECKTDSRLFAATGYGDTRPLVTNDTLEHRARNRRIELVLVNAQVKGKKSKDEAPTTYDVMEKRKESQRNLVEKEKKKH